MPDGQRPQPAMGQIQVLDVPPDLVDAVAAAHLASSQDQVNARLGAGYVRKTVEWFCASPDAVALCAVDGERRVVGYVIGAPLGYGMRFYRSLFWTALGAVARRPGLIAHDRFRHAVAAHARALIRPAPTSGRPELPAPTLSLVGIGVLPAAQGAGVGRALMAAFEDRAARRGMRSMRLSVTPDNLPACRLYDQAGWHPYRETAHPDVVIYYYKALA